MLKKITVAIVIFVSATAANAAELSTKTATHYIGNNGSVVVDNTVQQTNLFVPLLAGFYVDIWNSTSLSSKSNEIDWTAGWAGEIDNINVNLGASYYDFDKLFSSKGDVINPYIEISKSLCETLTLMLKVEVPILVTDGSVAGTFTHVGVKHVWKAAEHIDVIQNVRIMYDDGVYGMDNGFVGKYSASLAISITKSVSVNASLDASKPFGSINDRKMEVTPSIGLSVKF